MAYRNLLAEYRGSEAPQDALGSTAIAGETQGFATTPRVGERVGITFQKLLAVAWQE